MSQAFLIRPVDTLFFKDGRPFNQDDEGLADARSVFPPFPMVLTGAFRAAAARRQGWDETRHRSWSGARARDGKTEISAVLGDRLALPDALRFGPPVLVREINAGWERLYPAPLHLAGRPQGGRRFEWAFLVPDEVRKLGCDLHDKAVALPALVPDIEGAEPLGRKWWLTPAGMQRVLAGEFPGEDELLEVEEIYAGEFRIGLQRDSMSRTAVAGALYAASHVRLVDSVHSNGATAGRYALGMMVHGIDPAWYPEGLQPVGAFQRLATFDACADWHCAECRPPVKHSNGKWRYALILTSPVTPAPSDTGWRSPGGAIGQHTQVVAACTGRPLMIGGWDGIAFGPRPLEPCLPPGSVFFVEADAPPTVPPPPVGTCTAHGFGECLIGAWPQPVPGRSES
jgi:CRISPR-associated protein Cmr3